MEEEILNVEVVGTVSPQESYNITSSGTGTSTPATQSDLATVEPSAAGDIVNGTQTNNNALTNNIADSGTETNINPANTTDYTNANRGLPPSSVGTPQQAIPNPLHSYASYTYGISLHLMTPQDFNRVMNSTNPLYIPTNVLIASAGRYNNSNFIRNPAFAEDFYFDDLKIASVIGMTPSNRSSNSIDISFTIIEPNGFTFINRLLEAATVTDSKNYLDIPYMLQLDFYGSTSDGTELAPIPNQTKHIPITITGIKSKVSSKGAEYRVTAVPYQHKALQQSVAATPTNLQVKAATVADFFGSGVAVVGIDGAYTAAASNYNDQQRIESLKKELAKTTDAAAKQDINFQIGQISDNLNQAYTAKSGYTDAVNGWYKFLQITRKRQTFDTVSIIVDPEIAASIITVPEKNDTRSVVDPTKSEQNAARASALGATVGGPKFSAGYYPIFAGTPIDKVIEDAIRNSSYITKQITDPSVDNPETAAQKLGRPLQWFKVVPKVVLGEYDYITGQYAKNYIYYVKKWTVTNKVPVAPMGKASGFVKKYEYLYSGHNSDIVDFNIDFDTLYYVQLTENKTNNQETINVKRPNRQVLDYNAPYIQPPNTAYPVKTVYHSQDLRDSAHLRNQLNPKTLAGSDTLRDLAGTARGDMLNVKLTILGDPTFIKQDEVFYNSTEMRSNRMLTANNSIVMDEGELYVLLFFKTGSDYDEVTGLNTSSRYSWSMFSGIYGITTVESSFSKGKFTQTLNMYRIQHQPAFDDLLGGQMGAVLQYQRIESQILNQALTSLQGISRNAAGKLLGTLSNVLSVATAAQQIAQNAQAIATGLISATINQAVNKVGGVVSGWFSNTVVTPLENWTKEHITAPLSEWFTEIKGDISDWFYDTFTSTGDKLYDMFSNASYVDIGSFTSNPEVFQWVAGEMGFETFDVVDPGVLSSIDP